MYYYQTSPTCFGAYCTVFRENFKVCSEQSLHSLDTDLKLHYSWAYNFIYNYLKTHIFLNVRLKMVKSLCKTLIILNNSSRYYTNKYNKIYNILRTA